MAAAAMLVLVLVLGDSAFVPTAEDMKLSPRAFHRKMCSGREVAGHAGFYVMVQYSASQLCSELQKLESWSAAAP